MLKKLGITYVYICDKYCFNNDPKIYTIGDLARYSSYIKDIRRISEKFVVYEATEGDIRTINNIAKNMIRDVMDSEFVFKMSYEPTKMTEDHLYETTIYTTYAAIVLAKELGFDRTDLLTLTIASLLKDVGLLSNQIDINDPEEYKSHPIWTYKYLKRNGLIRDAALAIMLQHHEHKDGSGFPRQLMGDEISISARLIAIVNFFYDLKSEFDDNPKTTFDHFEMELIQIIDKFDLDVAKVFMDHLELFALDAIVRLSNDDLAVIFENSRTNPFTPLVKIIRSNTYKVGELIQIKNINNLSILSVVYIS